MLSTYPQLIHSVLTVAALLFSLIAIGSVLYVKRLFLKDFPGRTTINELRAEVSEFSGDLADLTDRFARFQKREGMRVARAEKETQASLKEQAMAILAQGGNVAAGGVPSDPADIKAQLRRQLLK